MNNLTERLHNLQDHYPTSGKLGQENLHIFSGAADEIDRLRAALKQIANHEDDIGRKGWVSYNIAINTLNDGTVPPPTPSTAERMAF